VAFALGIVGFIGLIFMLPNTTAAIKMIGNLTWSSTNTFSLTAVPLFILMGEFLVAAKMNEDLYRTLSIWFGASRGGLCHATTISCAIFAAMSGSSIATTATLGNIASPEMLKRGYSQRLTSGTIAAGGTLGILIPPSIAMIIYGNLAGVSIGHCFMAGVIPGIILTLSFIIMVEIWVYFGKSRMRSQPVDESNLKGKFKESIRLIPPLTIILVVLGGIYLGINTPTEAGAVGAFCAFLLCLSRRVLNLQTIKKILLSTVRTTSFIMLILACASIVSFVVQYIRIPELFTKTIVESGLSRYMIIALFYFIFFVLGMMIDPISMMVMTLPTILPTIIHLGFDPIWFAVMVTISCEMGLITPPVGLNLFVMRGVSDIPLKDIAIGAAPFAVTMILNLIFLTAFPIVALWLPSQM
jgi:tripartite ATP-independent transporter DctM subunit